MKPLQLVPIFFIGCVLAATPRGTAQSPLLEALPADTIGVLAVDDIDHLKEVWSASRMGRLWLDAALEGARAEIDELIGEADGMAVELAGTSPVELLGMVHGPICLAMVPYDFGVDVLGDDRIEAGVCMFDTGEDLDAFSEGFDRFIDWVVESEGLVFKTESYADVDAAVIVDPERPSFDVRYGFVGSVLLITSGDISLGRDVFGEVVDGLTAQAESGFARDSPYRKSIAAGPDADIRLWVDVGELVRRIMEAEGLTGPGADDAELEDLGLTKLGALAAVVELTPDATHTRMSLGFTGLGWIQEVFLAGVDGQDPSLMRWIPDSASYGQALDLDLGAMFDAFLSVMMEQDPEEARDMIANMSEMEAGIGFHPRDDLLDNLNGQLAMFSADVPAGEGLPMTEPTGPQVNYALMLGLSDGEAMSATLDGVVRSQGMHVARQLEEFEGYSMYSMPVFPGVSLSYAVLDDLLVLSLSPSMVRDVLRRKANPELPTMMTVKDVMQRNELLPAERSYLGVQNVVDQMVNAFGSMAVLPAVLNQLDIRVDQQAFRFMGLIEELGAVDPEVIEKYYRGTYSLQSVSLSDEGILMVATGP